MTGPSTLSHLEVDRYSITHAIDLALSGSGWSVNVDQVTDLWPSGDEIQPPAVYVLIANNRTAPWELGAHGKQREVYAHIYATNDSERDRLSEEICDVFRDIIPIYGWSSGNETTPSVSGSFNTEGDVEFRHIPALANSPDVEKWRAVVQAILTRQDA